MMTSQRTLVLEFLKKYVLGKAVVAAPTPTRNDYDQIISVYEEDAIFSNLVETSQGFSFDMTVLARGTRYVPGKDGEEILAEGSLNVVRVLRYEMTERLSSGDLIGFSRFITSTNAHPDPFAGTIFLVRMWLRDGTLEVTEEQIGYSDVVSARGQHKPVAVDGKYSYAVDDSRLVVKYEHMTFDVDPETLARKPTGDQRPPQISKEIDFPPSL